MMDLRRGLMAWAVTQLPAVALAAVLVAALKVARFVDEGALAYALSVPVIVSPLVAVVFWASGNLFLARLLVWFVILSVLIATPWQTGIGGIAFHWAALPLFWIYHWIALLGALTTVFLR